MLALVIGMELIGYLHVVEQVPIQLYSYRSELARPIKMETIAFRTVYDLRRCFLR